MPEKLDIHGRISEDGFTARLARRIDCKSMKGYLDTTCGNKWVGAGMEHG